jgi:carbonic anhydrase/acetyltransferase-like protein (isoleucine patch superfamily)
MQGAEIPPNSLVAGVPAKVRRETTEDDVAAIRANAASYTGRIDQHRAVRRVQ